MIQSSSVKRLAFSTDGHTVAATGAWGQNPSITVWSLDTADRPIEIRVSTGEVERPGEFRFLPDMQPPVRAIVLNARGTLAAVATSTGVYVHDLRGGKAVARFASRAGFADVALNRDGTYIVACDSKGGIQIWNRSTNWTIHRVVLSITHPGGCKRVTFSPDTQQIALVDSANKVVTYLIPSGKPKNEFRHDSPVLDLTFSADGRYLATADSDGVGRIWNAVNGQLLSQVDHRGYVQVIGFTSDAKYLVTGGGYVVSPPGANLTYSSNFVRRWLWRPGDLIEEACGRLSRNLSSTEWNLFIPGETCRATCSKLPSGCTISSR
jgi:WD40 repeat protein